MRLAVLLLALLLAACGQPAPVAQESYVFGTRVEVLVWGARGVAAQIATYEVLREFDRLHRTYHAWQPSELTALNDAIAAGRPHAVSAELAELIIAAQALTVQSEHLFDPGIGRLVALWGFHGDEFKPALPDAVALAALVAAKPSITDLTVSTPPKSPDGAPPPTGGQKLLGRPGEFLERGSVVSSKNPAVALDFGGYLKGAALDRAAAILKTRGIRNALINIGGNVLALGKKGDKPWRVGIQHPRSAAAGGAPLATLELHDGEAIGTSGDYQRYFEVDGRRYSHLIDPRTGLPATATQALTVLIPPATAAGIESDVLSKPLFVAGDNWLALAQKIGVTQVLRIDAAGKIAVTAALRQRLAFDPANPDVSVVQ
ncbi:MAG: FAD:protein FMN transferase [Rhodocyclaceae bacterium]|nr:FAD:protein FMN transferase [Rhodocyclaceae bacterium]